MRSQLRFFLLRVSLCGREEKERLKNFLQTTKSGSQNRRVLERCVHLFLRNRIIKQFLLRFRIVHDSNLDKRVPSSFDLFKPAAVK